MTIVVSAASLSSSLISGVSTANTVLSISDTLVRFSAGEDITLEELTRFCSLLSPERFLFLELPVPVSPSDYKKKIIIKYTSST